LRGWDSASFLTTKTARCRPEVQRPSRWIYKYYQPEVPEEEREWPKRQALLKSKLLGPDGCSGSDVICIQEACSGFDATPTLPAPPGFRAVAEAATRFLRSLRCKCLDASSKRSDSFGEDFAFMADAGYAHLLHTKVLPHPGGNPEAIRWFL